MGGFIGQQPWRIVEQASGGVGSWAMGHTLIYSPSSHKKLLTFNIYRRYTKRSCRCGGHNAYLNWLGVPNDGGIQPHYHHRIDGFQLPVLFLTRPPYRSNRGWKYHTDAFIAMAVKVTTGKSQSVVVEVCFRTSNSFIIWIIILPSIRFLIECMEALEGTI